MGSPLFIEQARGRTWIGTSSGIWRADERHDLRLISEGRAVFVVERDDAVWAGTDRGIWHVTDNAGPVRVIEEAAVSATRAGSDLWIGTTEGIWRANAKGQTLRIARGRANDVRAADGDVWLATSAGLWRGDGTGPIVKVPIRRIDIAGGAVWAIGVGELYRFDLTTEQITTYHDQGVRIPSEVFGYLTAIDPSLLDLCRPRTHGGRQVTFVLLAGGALLLGTSTGLYRDPNSRGAIKLSDDPACFAKPIGDAVVVGTDRGFEVYFPKGKKFFRLNVSRARFAETAGGSIWLGSEAGTVCFGKCGKGNRVTAAPPWPIQRHLLMGRRLTPTDTVGKGAAQFVNVAGGTVFVGTDAGIWRADDTPGGTHLVGGEAQFVSKEGGHVWLGTGFDLWRLDDTGEPERVLAGEARFVREIGGRLWLATENQLWRSYNVQPTVSFDGGGSLWRRILSVVIPGVLIEGPAVPVIRYAVPAESLFADMPANHFTYRMVDDPALEPASLDERDFKPANEPEVLAPGFPSRLHVRIRDAWGNDFAQTVEVMVAPGARVLPFASAFLVLVLMAVAFLLAPWNRHCHAVLMNPYLRGYLSLGMVRLALSLSAGLRRHILRRYRRELVRSPEVRDAVERYVAPDEAFEPESFARRMSNHPKLLVHGPSGIGKTTFLHRFTAWLAGTHRGAQLPRGLVPVLVQVSRYAGPGGHGSSELTRTPQEMILAQLENLGDFSDKALGRWMIGCGGFVLIFDGLNEISESARKSIEGFIDAGWHRNWIVVSSQVPHPEFAAWGAPYKIGPLPPDKVDQIVRSRLGRERAEVELAEADKEFYSIYGLPQNLEIALGILKRAHNERFPRSRHDLYSALFDVQFAEWAAAGAGDNEPILCKRAFEMLCRRDPDLCGATVPIPSEVVAFLLASKLVRQSGGGHLSFAHNLQRDYLAARYFAPRWEELLANEVDEVDKVDSGWESMIQFTTEELIRHQPDPSQALKALAFALLEADPEAAAAGVSYLQDHAPALCEKWLAEFQRRYGERHMSTHQQMRSPV